MTQRTISLRDVEEERALFGSLDRNLHLLRRLFRVDAVSRSGQLRLNGEPDDVERAAEAVEVILDRLRSGTVEEPDGIERLLRSAVDGGGGQDSEDEVPLDSVVQPRSENQARYLAAIEENTVTFGIGPAGTGKTFLAVAAAVAFLKAGKCRRIVLCRPAVEAGESLGFLPGDLSAKIDPYLRPLYDALHAILPRGQLQVYMEKGVIEVLPLAYMRGRTLSRATIILDEAQNCTQGQMKMALTRLGANSKMIVTGDITQIDLPSARDSGLVQARHILAGVDQVAFVHFSKTDIARHPVVAEIVSAYTRAEENSRRDSRRRLVDEAGADGSSTELPPANRGGASRLGER